jgi:hypothetical protein
LAGDKIWQPMQFELTQEQELDSSLASSAVERRWNDERGANLGMTGMKGSAA